MVQVTGRFDNEYRMLYDGWRSGYTQARARFQDESSDDGSNDDESLRSYDSAINLLAENWGIRRFNMLSSHSENVQVFRYGR